MKRAIPLLLWCLSFPALAQSVTDVRALGSDKTTFVMRINGAPYTAFTPAQVADFRKALLERDDLAMKLDRAEKDLKALLASSSALAQIQKDNDAMIAKLKALAEDSQKLGEQYSGLATKYSALTKDYSQLVSDYDALAKKYRDIAMRSAPRQAIDLGAGYVHMGDSSHIVGMAGIGIALGVRAWVFGGQSTYGAMLGYSF